MSMTRKLASRTDVVTEWHEITIPVEYQVQFFSDGTALHSFKAPFWAQTFDGATREEALANLFNCHPLR